MITTKKPRASSRARKEQPSNEGRVQFPYSQPAPNVELVLADAMQWMAERDDNSIHAIVTDPPYGLIEFDDGEHEKLRKGRGGVWRIPPSFDGSKRSPLPRFTVLTARDRERSGKSDSTLWQAKTQRIGRQTRVHTLQQGSRRLVIVESGTSVAVTTWVEHIKDEV